MKIDWTSLTPEDRSILASIGVKEPKKKRKKSTKKYTNLKDKGVPIQIKRNIFCCCCRTTTVEFITSCVPKELISKDREAITDTIRTCKSCVDVLAKKSKHKLIDIILNAYRTFTY